MGALVDRELLVLAQISSAQILEFQILLDNGHNIRPPSSWTSLDYQPFFFAITLLCFSLVVRVSLLKPLASMPHKFVPKFLMTQGESVKCRRASSRAGHRVPLLSGIIFECFTLIFFLNYSQTPPHISVYHHVLSFPPTDRSGVSRR